MTRVVFVLLPRHQAQKACALRGVRSLNMFQEYNRRKDNRREIMRMI